MYMGSDGKRYNGRFDAFGKEPTHLELDRQKIIDFNRQLQENRSNQKDAALNRAIKKEQLAAMKRNNFYDNAREFANIHGRSFGPQQVARGGGSQSSKQSFGASRPSTQNRYEFNHQLIQDAGKLNQLLTDFSQTGKHDELLNFINGNAMIGIEDATGLRMDDQGDVTIFAGKNQAPVKQFNVAALRNLNNYGAQQHQQYDPGVQGQDIVKVQEAATNYAEQQALNEVANIEDKDQQMRELQKARQRYFHEYMDRFGNRPAGYKNTGTSRPYADKGFEVFGRLGVPDNGQSWQAMLEEKMYGKAKQNTENTTNSASQPEPPQDIVKEKPSNTPYGGAMPPMKSNFYPYTPYGL